MHSGIIWLPIFSGGGGLEFHVNQGRVRLSGEAIFVESVTKYRKGRRDEKFGGEFRDEVWREWKIPKFGGEIFWGSKG